MPFTENCDIFAGIEEDAVNLIVQHIARQRPSLFNYGTESFVQNPSLMCHDIEVAPALPSNQPRVAPQSAIPVPGTSGRYSMEYCAQLTKLNLDLHPSNKFPLPPELSPMQPQSFAIMMEVCGGFACPKASLLRELAKSEARYYPAIDPAAAVRDDDKPHSDQPSDNKPPILLTPKDGKVHCFCLQLFVTAKFVVRPGLSGPELGVDLSGLEIVDIRPEGLENSLECMLSATLALGVLPRIRIALNDIILDLGNFGSLTVGLTPTSATVPFNPSVADDRLSVFVDVDLN